MRNFNYTVGMTLKHNLLRTLKRFRLSTGYFVEWFIHCLFFNYGFMEGTRNTQSVVFNYTVGMTLKHNLLRILKRFRLSTDYFIEWFIHCLIFNYGFMKGRWKTQNA